MPRFRGDGPRCEHVPILVADPISTDYVKVECARCGATTGYALDPEEAWTAWRLGNVAMPGDFMEGES